jgi:hypothetical protein
VVGAVVSGAGVSGAGVSGPGPQREAFEYAVLRAVPRVDRGEFVNVGVVLYCQGRAFLGCAVRVDPDRLRALDPQADVEAVEAALAAVHAVCTGHAAGRAAHEPLRARFGWLTAPRSTVVQAGPVHSGLTSDPAADLDRLLTRLVG